MLDNLENKKGYSTQIVNSLNYKNYIFYIYLIFFSRSFMLFPRFILDIIFGIKAFW